MAPNSCHTNDLQSECQQISENCNVATDKVSPIWVQAAPPLAIGPLAGLTKRTPPAIAFGTAGFVLFLRAVTNQPVAQVAKSGTYEPQDTRTAKGVSRKSRDVPAGPNTPLGDAEHAASFSSPIQPVHRPSADELIDEASMESFPASDPPSFTRR